MTEEKTIVGPDHEMHDQAMDSLRTNLLVLSNAVIEVLAALSHVRVSTAIKHLNDPLSEASDEFLRKHISEDNLLDYSDQLAFHQGYAKTLWDVGQKVLADVEPEDWDDIMDEEYARLTDPVEGPETVQ